MIWAVDVSVFGMLMYSEVGLGPGSWAPVRELRGAHVSRSGQAPSVPRAATSERLSPSVTVPSQTTDLWSGSLSLSRAGTLITSFSFLFL